MSRKFIFGGSFAGAVPLLLDLYPAEVAYSVRKLRAAYTGACMRVRRSSDNTEQDIGFVGNNLDTAALLSFVGAGNGFVTAWYDQSGNARNATQTTAGNQPQIVSSGVVNNLNNLPSARIRGANVDRLNIQNALDITNGGRHWSVFSVANALNTGNGIVPTLIQWSCNNSINYRHALLSNFSTLNRFQVGGRKNASDLFSSATSTVNHNQQPKILTGLLNYNGSATLFENSIQTQINNSFFNAPIENTNASEAMIGGRTSVQAFNGNVSEMIIYATDQSANRVAIETNINAYYGIYP
jgi:hypothetical protein